MVSREIKINNERVDIGDASDLDILEALKTGEITGVVDIGNCIFACARFTGTGWTVRNELNEQGEDDVVRSLRPKDLFLSENFQKMCVGVPFLLEHPKDLQDPEQMSQLANPYNFKAYIIGTVLMVYPKQFTDVTGKVTDELWCIVRINDYAAIETIVNRKTIIETSPCITTLDSKGEFKNGETYNKEEKIISVDHLAVVDVGHWSREHQTGLKLDRKTDSFNQAVSGNSNLRETSSIPPLLFEDVTELKELENLKGDTSLLEEYVTNLLDRGYPEEVLTKWLRANGFIVTYETEE